LSPDLQRFSATRNGATTRDTGLNCPWRNPPFGGVCAFDDVCFAGLRIACEIVDVDVMHE